MRRSTAPRAAPELPYTGMTPSKHSEASTEGRVRDEQPCSASCETGEKGEVEHVCKIRAMVHGLPVQNKLLGTWDLWPKALWVRALHCLLCLWYQSHRDRSQLKAQSVIRSWKIGSIIMEGIIKDYHRLQEFPRVSAITLFHHSEQRAVAFPSGIYSAGNCRFMFHSSYLRSFYHVYFINFFQWWYFLSHCSSLFINPSWGFYIILKRFFTY